MKVRVGAIFFASCLAWQLHAQSPAMPRLVKTGNYSQLFVDNKPFLVLGGELGNSSASSNDYMRPIWPRLKTMNLNTVFAPVYWELMEPIEGQFDFRLVDSLILNARRYNMHLVLLWFGAWKNSMSCYVPAWVKTQTGRFPRALDHNGEPQEILTPFNQNNLAADQTALTKLMQHIKLVDGKAHTIIAIQVENEIGMLPEARSYDSAANRAFAGPVPQALAGYLQANGEKLAPEIHAAWTANGKLHSGTWEEMFGKSLATDEIFMAWYYAVFVNKLAVAVKSIYSLPMYVNAALNRPGRKPGEYPSAGPLPHIIDIWKAGAPDIDWLSPDFYNPDFEHWCELYARPDNPLFIPEIRFEPGIDAKAFFAFGHFNCLAFSPFSIESAEHPEKESIGKSYRILQQIAPLITRHKTQDRIDGFLLEKNSMPKEFDFGSYHLTIRHEYTLGWSAGSKGDDWPMACAIVIAIAPDEFYVAGTGVVITAESKDGRMKTGFLRIDEGNFENEKWMPGRRMNGDQDHQGRHIRIPMGEYSIQRVKLYSY